LKAIAYVAGRLLTDDGAFVLIEQETPEPVGRDLLVSIRAISANPVDTKVRVTVSQENSPRVLGWDAAGVVEAIGEDVKFFKPGDKVFYAGDITRPGSNASHQLVDERIVGRHPASLSYVEAAAMPLTSITAWEALFSRLKINPDLDAGKHILIIGAAGGVGSIAIQLAKTVAKLQVTATASRQETRDWCRSLGADHIINHHKDLASQMKDLGIGPPDCIFCLSDTDHYFPVMAELIAPQGMICAIVGGNKSHDLSLLKSKSAGIVWEFMFTRSMYQTRDMGEQHELLNKVADLLDSGQIRTTMKRELGQIGTESIRQAHQILESGHSIGKIVLGGFDNNK